MRILQFLNVFICYLKGLIRKMKYIPPFISQEIILLYDLFIFIMKLKFRILLFKIPLSGFILMIPYISVYEIKHIY